MAQQTRALFREANGIANVLIVPCTVSTVFNPATEPHPPSKPFNALWDTGATNSAITQAVIDALALTPMSMAQVHGVHGPQMAEVYLIGLALPNGVEFMPLRVTKGIITSADVLIGMDIINQGDFAVSNFEGRTSFTYRVPSKKKIDFVEQANRENLLQAHQPQHGGRKQKRPKRHKQFGKNKHNR